MSAMDHRHDGDGRCVWCAQDWPCTTAKIRHELAEKIRDAYTGDGPDEDNWIISAFDAAKLIDAEVD